VEREKLKMAEECEKRGDYEAAEDILAGLVLGAHSAHGKGVGRGGAEAMRKYGWLMYTKRGKRGDGERYCHSFFFSPKKMRVLPKKNYNNDIYFRKKAKYIQQRKFCELAQKSLYFCKRD